MTKEDFDPLAFTTAVNTLAVAIAQNLSEDELALLTAVLVQLTGTLTTITVQQTLYGKQKDGQTMAMTSRVWRFCLKPQLSMTRKALRRFLLSIGRRSMTM